MSSSGTYNFTITQQQIIRNAMLAIQQLDEVEAPTAQEYTDCASWLNMLVKQWQGKADFAPGLKTFTRRHGHLFLSNTTGRYVLGPGAVGWTINYVSSTLSAAAAAGQAVVPVVSSAGILAGDNFGFQTVSGSLYWGVVQTVVGNNVTLTAPIPTGSNGAANAVLFDYTTTATQPVVIETAFLRDITNTDTPIKILNVQEYDFLPSKTNPQFVSDPSAVYYENLLTNSYLYTDCAAANDTSKHICLTYLEPVQDITNPNDTTVYPQEWFLPLVLGLAKLIAPMFAAAWTPNLQTNLDDALAIARRKEPETSRLYFASGEDL
jgi:hypothetical protein